MASQKDTTECPYCKETVKSDAVKCKHCLSKLEAKLESHEGVCPFCKEEIHKDAIKCKHCKSNLTMSKDCGCKGDNDNVSTMFRMRQSNTGVTSDQLKCAFELLDCLDNPLTNDRYCFNRHKWCNIFGPSPSSVVGGFNY